MAVEQMNFTDAEGNMIGTPFKWPKRKPKDYPDSWWDTLKRQLRGNLSADPNDGVRISILVECMRNAGFHITIDEASHAIWQLGYDMRLQTFDGMLPLDGEWHIYNRKRAEVTKEVWRGFDMFELVTDSKILGALNAAKIHTAGDLHDFIAKGNKFTDIKGIGKVAAEALQEAVGPYWNA